MDGGELLRGDLGLRTADVGGAMEQLSMQVREFHSITVDEANPIDSIDGELNCRRGTEAADADDHDRAPNRSALVANPRQGGQANIGSGQLRAGRPAGWESSAWVERSDGRIGWGFGLQRACGSLGGRRGGRSRPGSDAHRRSAKALDECR